VNAVRHTRYEEEKHSDIRVYAFNHKTEMNNIKLFMTYGSL